MAEATCRVLRDGALEGELAPALTIKDSILSPLAFHVFDYVLSQLSSFILAGKSQSRGMVIVAFARSPSYYIDLLKSSGIDGVSLDKWVRILDCYNDPLGWKHRLKESGRIGSSPDSSFGVTVFRDVRNLEKLLSGILELGKGIVGQGKDQYCIAIDSATELLRDVPLSSVASLLSNIRCHGQVSSTFWLLHSDIHHASTIAALEYTSSIVASVEGSTQLKNGQQGLLEQNLRRAKLRVRLKRRNGRVRLMSEEFHVDQSGITFKSISSEEESMAQTLVPKVQFNLDLSEKEQIDRSKVILPFEHQEADKANQIYDGRRSLMESQNGMATEAEKTGVTEKSSRGEIVYLRDSDDERPDSDEDPDDDLDI
ncbi:elongator complex protein 5-like [Chenopodium quinoa]|uniref:elongator complex protein 5-like n=1 Tax=Chenopodium quinoa TaxID=63459 RepID=UPI000B7994C2|nr:elongator complex protein 5-like [Chenopodium quinoa]